MRRSDLARLIDHTLLRPEATAGDVTRLCAEATELGVHAVCVSPSLVGAAADALEGSEVVVCTVAGFPAGAHTGPVKRLEAEQAAARGAAEVDMVIGLGLARAGAWDAVEEEIRGVRSVVPGVLKVIIEAAALTRDELVRACAASEGAGADYVKSSTGFHPAGGASVETIALMAATVGGRLGVKASGGIGNAELALALVEAGATRLGMSRSAAVLAELD